MQEGIASVHIIHFSRPASLFKNACFGSGNVDVLVHSCEGKCSASRNRVGIHSRVVGVGRLAVLELQHKHTDTGRRSPAHE